MIRKCLVILYVLLFVCLTVSSAGENKKTRVPDWLCSDKPISSNQVSQKDYPYIVRWVDEHAKSAQDYVVRLFDKHQIVIFGEEHNVKEHKDFVINLIPRLYHEAGVRCIGWEFSWYSQNEQLVELINAQTYDDNAVLQLARERSPDFPGLPDHGTEDRDFRRRCRAIRAPGGNRLKVRFRTGDHRRCCLHLPSRPRCQST